MRRSLAARLGITPQGTLKIVAEMIGKGYMHRTDDETDRRITRLTLSARGKRAIAEARRFSRNVRARPREPARDATRRDGSRRTRGDHSRRQRAGSRDGRAAVLDASAEEVALLETRLAVSAQPDRPVFSTRAVEKISLPQRVGGLARCRRMVSKTRRKKSMFGLSALDRMAIPLPYSNKR